MLQRSRGNPYRLRRFEPGGLVGLVERFLQQPSCHVHRRRCNGAKDGEYELGAVLAVLLERHVSLPRTFEGNRYDGAISKRECGSHGGLPVKTSLTKGGRRSAGSEADVPRVRVGNYLSGVRLTHARRGPAPQRASSIHSATRAPSSAGCPARCHTNQRCANRATSSSAPGS